MVIFLSFIGRGSAPARSAGCIKKAWYKTMPAEFSKTLSVTVLYGTKAQTNRGGFRRPFGRYAI
jgi:hypothetical protein